MKKTVTALIPGILLFITVAAQKTGIGVVAGGNLSNYWVKEDNLPKNSFLIAGYSFGVIADIPVSGNIVLQPGLYLVKKGGASSARIGYRNEDEYRTFSCIELPVNLLYSNKGFFIGAGPFISFNISGKLHWKYYGEDHYISMPLGNSNDDFLKVLDVGANIIAGYQAKYGLRFMIDYNHGFTNLIPGDASKGKMVAHYFGIRAAYRLHLKRK